MLGLGSVVSRREHTDFEFFFIDGVRGNMFYLVYQRGEVRPRRLDFGVRNETRRTFDVQVPDCHRWEEIVGASPNEVQ